MDLAKRLQVSLRAVTYWESGQRQPRPDTVERLGAILHVRASYFFIGEGE
jgi:transcriptional regulator with XRE-family HTH domain